MLGIVILNYNAWDISLRCLRNIHATQRGMEYWIYFVDNASSKPMTEEIRRYIDIHDEIRYIKSKKNGGYAAGNNLGIAAALKDGCGEILIANNDILFEEKSIRQMAAALRGHPGIGIVGPKIVVPAGKPQTSRCSMRTGMLEIFQIFTVAKFFCRRKWKKYYCLDQDPDKPADVYYVSGCCFMISRECAEKVTPLDEGTILYDEEMILGLRMERAGYRTRYEPKSVVVHQHGGTTDAMQPFMYLCIAQSELYYCSRYLQAGRWQLWLLYQYRKVLYAVRSRKSSELRAYSATFQRELRRAFTACRYRD